MADWKEHKFSELVKINAESIGRSYPFEEIKYLDTGSITKGKIDGFQDYKIADAPSRAKRLVRDFDIVYSTVRPIQRHYGLIRNPLENLVVSTGFAVLSAIPEKANPKYLYYFLTSDDVVNYLDVVADGSTSAYPSLTPNVIADLEILLPPLAEQQAIAEVLSSLDDKIDLLHRQNKTLEAIAETLFRQWFVEESEASWDNFRISDLGIYTTDFVANGSFASLKQNVTLIPEIEDYALFIRNTDLKSGFSQRVYVDKHSYEFLSKSKLFGGEIIISNVADVGSVHICPKFNKPMTLGNNVIMLKSNFNLFLYLFFKSEIGQSLIYGITSGSAQQKFNKTDFRNSEITIPSIQYLSEFHAEVEIYFGKMEKNQTQIRSLTKLRDELLPKLMSGDEVRVKM